MKFILLTAFTFLIIFNFSVYAAKHTDDFDGTKLNKMWEFRTPDGNDKYEFKGGWFRFIILAGQDLYKQGVDQAPMLLTDPPADDANFSIETLVNPLVDVNAQPPACQAGLIIFREDIWAYTLWGPYTTTDIRVEDCIGQDYRWRDQAQIGINKVSDKDVYLKIVKKGNELEFFYKDNEGDKWDSGGVDTKLGPKFEKGKYKIGLFVKNWGGSVASKFDFDYFHCPELGMPVEAAGKVATTWAKVKK